MPQFYFDVLSGGGRSRDEAGMALAKAEDLPKEVFDLLTGLAQERSPADHLVLTAHVRDETDCVIYRSTLVLSGESYFTF